MEHGNADHNRQAPRLIAAVMRPAHSFHKVQFSQLKAEVPLALPAMTDAASIANGVVGNLLHASLHIGRPKPLIEQGPCTVEVIRKRCSSTLLLLR
jgi:hypothetical protein